MPRSLLAHPDRTAPSGPVICVVMDGVGLGDGGAGDAVAAARTPHLDALRALQPAQLRAHGVAVGMPSDGDMGNSEVGHNALGAGRIYDQGAKLVADAVATGRLFEGRVWTDTLAQVASPGATLHFMGLLSDGNVHSHIEHLEAMLQHAARQRVQRVRVHALLDGRDVSARSALTYAARLESLLASIRSQGLDYQVASGGGRMVVTMDRYEADWAMVQRGWDVHVRGVGRQFGSLEAAIQTLYAESDHGDQDLEGFVIADRGAAVGPIVDGDAVVFFNFRGDRAIEISKAFEADVFDAFDRGPRPDVSFVGMMQYDGDEAIPNRYLVTPPAIEATMGELLAAAGRRQIAIAETQKFGHVTYFWNGNRSGAFEPSLERYIEVRSDTLPFEQRPWMKAAEVTDALLTELRSEPADFVRLNYANGDMVGHTGDFEASRIAVETVDLCLGRLVEATRQLGGALLVTADHGNADVMLEANKAGELRPRTSHSLNPVPIAIFDARTPDRSPLVVPAGAGLGNVAATCLELLGFKAPDDYLPSLLG